MNSCGMVRRLSRKPGPVCAGYSLTDSTAPKRVSLAEPPRISSAFLPKNTRFVASAWSSDILGRCIGRGMAPLPSCDQEFERLREPGPCPLDDLEMARTIGRHGGEDRRRDVPQLRLRLLLIEGVAVAGLFAQDRLHQRFKGSGVALQGPADDREVDVVDEHAPL